MYVFPETTISVGETDSLLGRARGARAVAATDARLLRLDRATFRSMCLDRPEIAVQVMERLAQRSLRLVLDPDVDGADLERHLARLELGQPRPREHVRLAKGVLPVGELQQEVDVRVGDHLRDATGW